MTRHAPDDERDAWLSQALRHAPDANADVPSALSAAILREARSAVARPPVRAPAPAPATAPARAPRRGSRSHWLGSAWNWLARPPVAAGFATVVMATLVGIMWRDRSLDEALPHPQTAVSTARQSSAGAGSASVTSDREPVAAAADSSASPTTSADMARPAESRKARAVKTESAPAASPTKLADAPVRERAGASAAAATAMPAAQPAATPTTETQAPTQRRESSAPVGQAAPLRDELRAVQGSADGTLAKARLAGPGSAPLAELLAAVARQPDRWRWQRGGGEAQPMNPSLQRWLAELDRAAASRWSPATGRAPREGPSALRLLRDGVPQAMLGFDGSVWLETPDAAAPTSSFAPLPQASIDALERALDEAAR